MKRGKRLASSVGLCVLVTIPVLINLLERGRDVPENPASMEVGNLDGGRLRLGEVLKKKSVVAILDAGCGQCVELAILISFAHTAYKDSGVALVSVFTDEPDTVRSLKARYRLTQDLFCAAANPVVVRSGASPLRVLLMTDGTVTVRLGPGLTTRHYADKILEFLSSRPRPVGDLTADTYIKLEPPAPRPVSGLPHL